MSDFTVYQNKSLGAENYPYLLDVQSELLSGLDTRLVIPLMKREDLQNAAIRNLNPIAKVADIEYVIMTQQMAAVPKVILGEKASNSEFSRSDVLTSIDFLITGI